MQIISCRVTAYDDSVNNNSSSSAVTFITPLRETTYTSLFGRIWECDPNGDFSYGHWCIPLGFGNPTFDVIQFDIGSGWFNVSYSMSSDGYPIVAGYTNYCPTAQLIDYEDGYTNGIKTVYSKVTNSGSGGTCS